jgi:hypothetical protein
MTYKIIQPPFTLKFREMSSKELGAYFQWFMGMLPERINELANVVRQTPGFEAWQPDNLPTSLDALGDWLSNQVETRQRTEEELQEIKSRSSYPIDVSGKELTNKTFSLVMDTGMYLSQVFLQNHSSLRWNQEFGNKKFIDYGQPVLVEFSSAPFNPIRMMVTLAYGLVDKTRNGRRLREVYDYWAKQVRTKA